MYVSGDATSRRGDRGEVVRDDSFLLLVHAGHAPIEFKLPGRPWADIYRIVLDSGHDIHRDRPALWLHEILRFAGDRRGLPPNG